MAKKIRFPLEMENGAEVRGLDELKENFSLTQVLLYLENGKLIAWLRDRYEDEIADALEKLELSDKELPRKVSEIFGVPYDDEAEQNMERALKRKRKLNLFTEYNIDSKYKQNVDNIAYDQDDLYDLLDSGAETVYLYGEKFYIPLGKGNVSYIGINEPVAVISSEKAVDFSEKGITFENCVFNEEYAQLVAEYEKVKAIKDEVKVFADKMIVEIDGVIDKIVNYEKYSVPYAEKEYEIWNFECYGQGYYIYKSKSEAENACKKAVKSALSDYTHEWKMLKNNIKLKVKDYCIDFENTFFQSLYNLWTAYDKYMKLCCNEAAENYLLEHKDKIMENYSDIMKEKISKNLYATYTTTNKQERIKRSRNRIINFNTMLNTQVKESLKPDENIFNAEKYYDMCDYSDIGPDEEYAFYVYKALGEMKSKFRDFFSGIWYDFPNKVAAVYKEAMTEHLEQLKDKIKALY